MSASRHTTRAGGPHRKKLDEACDGPEVSINGFESKVCRKLEEKYAAKNNRLQSALADLRMGGSGAPEAVQRAKAELLVAQSYDVIECYVNEDTPGVDARLCTS